MEPPPGIAPGWPAYRAGASLKMLWGHRRWSARDDLHVQGCLILSQVGLLFPVNHAPRKWRLTGFAPAFVKSTTTRQTGDLLHERQTRKLQAPTSKSQ